MSSFKLDRRTFHSLAISAAAATLAAPARSQDRRITIVVGGGPGGGVDTVGRLFARKLSDRLSIPVLVDNKPGASSAIAASLVAKARPDGQTLLLTNNAPLVARPHMVKEVPYDPVRDFTPVSKVASVPLVLVAGRSVPASTVAELIAHVRRMPGQLNYASNGIGGVYHLTTELFDAMAGLDMKHIPYKEGDAAMLNSLLAGETQVAFVAVFTSLPHIRSGALKCLGVTTPVPIPHLPAVPPIQNTLRGFEMLPWYGLFLPPGAPAELVARLNTDVHAVLKDEEFSRRMVELGNVVEASSPQQLGELVRVELKRHGEIVKAAKITPE